MGKSGCKLLLLALVTNLVPLTSASGESLDEAASRLVREFSSQLKPALLEAMTTGGPAHGVSVCAERAPAISRSLGDSSGWQVRRVSLKPRNPDAGADAFEARVLNDFIRLRQSGAEAAQLRHAEEVNGQYRYLQAQLTEGICLTCHGKEIEPGLSKMIEQYYPGDQATGFSLGDVRGAISLTRPMVKEKRSTNSPETKTGNE